MIHPGADARRLASDQIRLLTYAHFFAKPLRLNRSSVSHVGEYRRKFGSS
jgi:hypothetical protein